MSLLDKDINLHTVSQEAVILEIFNDHKPWKDRVTMDSKMLLMLIVLPFIGSAVAAFFRTNIHNVEAWFAGAIATAELGITTMFYPLVINGGVVRSSIQWLPQYGLNFTLRMDGFAWMFAMLVTGIGLLVIVYARYYMSREDPIPRFFAFFLSFMGAMLGIVLSGNLVLLSIFWELTSIFSFLLIGYWYQNVGARDGARMALTITGIGGFGLLIGVLLIGHIVGSYDLDKVLAAGETIRSHPLFLPVMMLILLGALTKSAQFPFHFWLPNAMAAPTPVSAYLHSATMVKAGVFLMARLWPVFSGTDEWFWIVGFAGLSTLVLGAFFAMFQQDLKGLLAYSTISHLGLITVLLSLGSPLAAVAAVFHMVNHATFKASLFMAAGIIDHETGTRDMRRLSGLFHFMPITTTLAMVASAAMAGVPLLNGFLSKEMFFAEAVATHLDSTLDTVTPYFATLASIFSVAYSLRFIHSVFFGLASHNLPRKPNEPPRWMRFPIEFLVLACLVVGIIPSLTIGPYLHTAVIAILGSATPHYDLAVWHGFSLPLLMSIIAFSGGVILYFMLRNYFSYNEHDLPFLYNFKKKRIFERILIVFSWRWARFAESYLTTRRLQPQLLLLILAALIAGFLPLYSSGIQAGNLPLTPVDFVFALMWLFGIVCAIGAAYQAKFHRLAALIMLSGTGVVTCMTFAWLSAPDLAVTQLLVEVITTVLILLGLRWLPKRWKSADPVLPTPLSRLRRYRDCVVAISGGIGVALLSLAVMTRPAQNIISSSFLQQAYSGGGGRNVVNVILVDFRSFDTFGEIAVLCVVSLSIFSLLRRFRPAVDNLGSPIQQKIQNAFDASRLRRKMGDPWSSYLMVPAVIMQWLFPVMIVFSIHLFMRGHDLPGGGFAAGITLAIAFILQYLAAGTRWVENHLRILPLRWMGLGLLCVVLTGAGSWLMGYPFLTSYVSYADVPIIGKVPLATSVLFDLGVFSLVVGSTVLMLIALAHQSIRSHRVDRTIAITPQEERQ